MDSVVYSSCQQKAYDLLQGSSQNIFLTGVAGSGKSFLIRSYLRDTSRRDFPILASTGAAAVLIGGRTFHSFFGLGIMEGGVDKTVATALKDRRVVKRLKKIAAFVLDEVSMIPGSALRAAETISRLAREDERPWGGIRVIAVGDFAQLPPVSQRSAERDWAFRDEAWQRSEFCPVFLKSIMRSQDAEYTDILNLIRDGHVDNTVEAYLNRKIECDAIDVETTHLFSRRKPAEQFCHMRLEEIRETLVEIPTAYSGDPKLVERLKKVAPVPEILRIKPSCLVMLRVNDPKWRYVNGSIGTVESICDDELVIHLRSGRVIEIQKTTFSLLDAEGKAIATATNFPIILAYATTIHKAQGATLDRLVTNLSGLWDPGQAYVALSRLSHGDGLTLMGWDEASIRVDPAVTRFHQGLAR